MTLANDMNTMCLEVKCNEAATLTCIEKNGLMVG